MKGVILRRTDSARRLLAGPAALTVAVGALALIAVVEAAAHGEDAKDGEKGGNCRREREGSL